jgi:EmrB/QacA subfamily drug resistance transporter
MSQANRTATEAAASCPAPDPRRWLVLPVLLVGAMMAPLDFFIVNVALPAIRAGLHMSAAQVQFVIAAYTVAYAVLLAISGRLGDLYGRKRMFVGGMLGFAIASALCGLAPSPEVLIFGRLVQGIAAAIMVPQVLATIQTIFPAIERPRVLGVFGAIFGLAAILGQLAGGTLIAWHPAGLTWQTIFLVNVPICAIGVIAAARLLREHRPSRGEQLDVAGVILLTLALTLLVYPAVEGREAGWPAWSLVSLASVLPCLFLFVRVEQWQLAQGRAPLVDLRLFANPRFTLGLVIAFLFYGAAAFFLTYALYLEEGLGWAPLPTSLAILPHGVAFFLGPFATPFLLRRLGSGVLNLGSGLMVIGFSITCASVLWAGGPGLLMYAGLFCIGLGQGFVLPSLVRLVLQEARTQHAGLAAGLINSTLQIGATLSVSVIGGVFFTILGPNPEPARFVPAFAVTLACIALVNVACFVLALVMRRGRIARATHLEEAGVNPRA